MDRCSISGLGLSTQYKVECYRDGAIAWMVDVPNLVVNTGLKYVMDRSFGEEEALEWWIGLCLNANASPTDTMEDHQFIEFLGTTNIYRSGATFEDGGEVEGNKYTYVAENVQQMITENASITGVFMTSETRKGVDEGILYGVASFPEPKTVVPQDALVISVTVSAKG